MKAFEEKGFTLLELMLAMSILVALLALAFAGLRAGLLPWERGQERADAHQHARSLAGIMARTIQGTSAYRAPVSQNEAPSLLFLGDPTRLSLITTDAPLPGGVPIAFTAVSLGLEGDPPGLVIRQKALPNFDPFEPVTPALTDPNVTRLSFRYLRDGAGWEDRWDAKSEGALPSAVEVTVSTALHGQRTSHPPITIPIRVSPR